ADAPSTARAARGRSRGRGGGRAAAAGRAGGRRREDLPHRGGQGAGRLDPLRAGLRQHRPGHPGHPGRRRGGGLRPGHRRPPVRGGAVLPRRAAVPVHRQHRPAGAAEHPGAGRPGVAGALLRRRQQGHGAHRRHPAPAADRAGPGGVREPARAGGLGRPQPGGPRHRRAADLAVAAARVLRPAAGDLRRGPGRGGRAGRHDLADRGRRVVRLRRRRHPGGRRLQPHLPPGRGPLCRLGHPDLDRPVRGERRDRRHPRGAADPDRRHRLGAGRGGGAGRDGEPSRRL
ncbi:MAG: hypothetical protein AVDCRST_MAG41-4101, partial [uncultured Corynebacteriales bacterium]